MFIISAGAQSDRDNVNEWIIWDMLKRNERTEREIEKTVKSFHTHISHSSKLLAAWHKQTLYSQFKWTEKRTKTTTRLWAEPKLNQNKHWTFVTIYFSFCSRCCYCHLFVLQLCLSICLSVFTQFLHSKKTSFLSVVLRVHNRIFIQLLSIVLQILLNVMQHTSALMWKTARFVADCHWLEPQNVECFALEHVTCLYLYEYCMEDACTPNILSRKKEINKSH